MRTRSFPAAFERIAASARHDPAGQSDLIELRRLVDLQLAELRQAIALRAEKGPAGSEVAASPEQTRTTMDRIREIIKRRHHNRLDLLSVTGETTRRQMKWVHLMTWMAGLLGVGAGVFAFYFYRVDYYQERGQRKLLEEKLHAEQSVREKSAFLANMSHEIRSPMNAILGFSELLEPDGLTPKQAQYVRAIRDSGAALLHLINDILDLSKLEAGQAGIAPRPDGYAGFVRVSPHRFRAAGLDEVAPASVRALAGPAPSVDAGSPAVAPGAGELAQQCH